MRRPCRQRDEHDALPIASYGLLSDCSTAALVGADGSIDWLCLPRFDSPAVFARLLDSDAGHWSIAPVGDCTVTRRGGGAGADLPRRRRPVGGPRGRPVRVARGHALRLASPAVGEVWAALADGAVWRSADHGITWEQLLVRLGTANRAFCLLAG